MIRAPAIARIAMASALGSWAMAAAAAEPAAKPGSCVEFGKPKATTTYVYSRKDSSGNATRYTHRWTEFTAERSSVSVARGKVNEVVANRHRIEDEVSMIVATASRSSGGNSRTDFRPAAMGEPMFKACAGRNWKIRAVAATHTAGAQVTTANTYPGTMRIEALRETVQVPAGRFASVRYTRTLATPTGSSVDQYWKSIEHGVVVKQVTRLGAWSATSELVAIQ